MSEKKIRAPYLARLELLKRCQTEDLQCSMTSMNFMHQYFSQFGEKGCVVGDLRLYLNLLKPKSKFELFEKVKRIESNILLYICIYFLNVYNKNKIKN